MPEASRSHDGGRRRYYRRLSTVAVCLVVGLLAARTLLRHYGGYEFPEWADTVFIIVMAATVIASYLARRS
jgi:hypothetical protein